MLIRVYCIPKPVQRQRFCNKLHSLTSVSDIFCCVQVLEQDQVGAVGGYGSVHWKKSG